MSGHRTLRIVGGTWASRLAAFVIMTLHPGAATAQHRLKMSGSVALTQSYDDNVFAVPDDRRQDAISRLTPRLGVSYRSRHFDVRARYAREAEAFSQNRELSTLRARQEGTLDVQWFPWAGFEATGGASYVETNSPGEFTVITGLDLVGLQLRRELARRFSTTGSLSRRLGARTRAVVTHGLTRDELVRGVRSANQVATARLDRLVGPVDTLSLAYGLRRFTAAGDGSTSHALTLAWARDVTPQTHLELKAGPRFSGGKVDPELGATLRHRFQRGEAALSYVQTETALIGRPTPVTADGLSATFTRSLNRTLTVTAGPSVFRARGKALEATVYGTSLELAWHLSRHLSLAGSHQLSIQYGELDGRPRGEIVHNTVLLRLLAGAVN